jgi:hypothetical protein
MDGLKMDIKIAQKSDWQNHDMSEDQWSTTINKSYTIEEFEKIKIGLIPQQMEDKWFIYFEEPWLYLHRSWSGNCIFKVRFETNKEEPNLIDIVEVIISQKHETFNSLQILLTLLKFMCI